MRKRTNLWTRTLVLIGVLIPFNMNGREYRNNMRNPVTLLLLVVMAMIHYLWKVVVVTLGGVVDLGTGVWNTVAQAGEDADLARLAAKKKTVEEHRAYMKKMDVEIKV